LNYFHFLLKRFLKIYPVYYLSLVLGIIVFIFRGWSNNDGILALSIKFNAKDLFLSLTGSYAFWGEWGGPFITTSWFIALIMTMYICYPFLSRMISNRQNRTMVVILTISCLSRILVNFCSLPMRPLDWFPLCRVFEFALGIYLSKSLVKFSIPFINSSEIAVRIINYISRLSFPIFLVHSVFMFIMGEMLTAGYNNIVTISVFIIFTLVFSVVILAIDERIPRKKWLDNFLSARQ
jgi:peptidoglycan/LPS O-acetylase OafA/YrhL